MKKRMLSALAVTLLGAMILSTFAACKDKPLPPDEPQSSIEDTTAPSEEKEPVRESILQGEYAALVENAKWLENGVNAYFATPTRDAYTVENQKMKLNYSFDTTKPQFVTSLTTPGGKPYLTDTMDVYVKMENGKTYLASSSTTAGTANIYRLGYYYYDVHLADQNFIENLVISNEKSINLSSLNKSHDMTRPEVVDGVLTTTATSTVDPYIYGNVKFRTSEVNMMQVTMRTTNVSELQLYLEIDKESFSNERWVRVPVINDGDWHTYTFMLNDGTVKDYSGMVTACRLDFIATSGDKVEIKDIKTFKIDDGGAPALYLDRTLHVFSDKMNHVVRICAAEDTTGIAEIGQITEIAADTVDKLIVKDASGEHTSLDGVDWASAEYIAFDIKGVGILGYILLKDASSGSMQVTLSDGKYTIVQSRTPEGGTILAPVNSTENDFYMGQRIYTDLGHDFDAFRKAANEERNPLSAENIKVDTQKSPYASFIGYNAIRGAYQFEMEPQSNFNTPYYESWNKHYNLVFDITGDDVDRNIYVMTYAHGTCLENGVLLGKGDMLLPVSLEVCKNFTHEKEEPLFDCGDDAFSETYFPVTLQSGKTEHFTVLNLYQNWGNYPLKQISSIQFFSPYYHLSTGVSESNCIAPYYVYHKDLFTLPDHRAMSAPLWSEMENPESGIQPQHTNGGQHAFLQYFTEDGKHYASDNTQNIINSYGPTYADIDMSYISDDGKIKVTYNHMEMPQTDENRTYYQMTYEVLEDVTFQNFKRDFSFYSVRGLSGDYEKLGYLDASNKPQMVTNTEESTPVYYTLGDQFPYFDMCKIYTGNTVDYVNVAFLVASSEFIIGGQKCTAPFVVKNVSLASYLTLDLEQVTLKKGDTFTINAIIMPWGSQLTDYRAEHPDQNVLDVRQNSIIDPLKVDVAVGENISSIFLPQIKAANDTAEFTLSGGANNISLRVYGFSALTVPKIYEKVDGKWVEYKVNSHNSPDTKGFHHYYDGYMVHYDGDGTFSYSFVVTMSDKARTFKVELDKEFAGWPEDPNPEQSKPETPDVPKTPMNLYFTPAQLEAQKVSAAGFGKFELASDGSYLRLYGDNASGEAYFTVFSDNRDESGKYAVIRYRTSTSVQQQFTTIEFFSGTTTTAPTGNKDYAHTPGIIEDGEWHVMVFDLEAFGLASFTPADDGTFAARFLRLDAFGTVTPDTTYMDIAYVAMNDSLDEIKEFSADIESIQLATGFGAVENIPTK